MAGRTLVLDNGTTYTVMAVDSDEADSVGCPTADSKVSGQHQTVYGFTFPLGRQGVRVRTRGWSDQRGQRVRFVSADAGETMDVRGYLVQRYR